MTENTQPAPSLIERYDRKARTQVAAIRLPDTSPVWSAEFDQALRAMLEGRHKRVNPRGVLSIECGEYLVEVQPGDWITLDGLGRVDAISPAEFELGYEPTGTFTPIASEALYGFVGWLTSCREAVTMSASHDAARPAELVELYCRTNNLAEPREGWHNQLRMPAGTLDCDTPVAAAPADAEASLAGRMQEALNRLDSAVREYRNTVNAQTRVEYWRDRTQDASNKSVALQGELEEAHEQIDLLKQQLKDLGVLFKQKNRAAENNHARAVRAEEANKLLKAQVESLRTSRDDATQRARNHATVTLREREHSARLEDEIDRLKRGLDLIVHRHVSQAHSIARDTLKASPNLTRQSPPAEPVTVATHSVKLALETTRLRNALDRIARGEYTQAEYAEYRRTATTPAVIVARDTLAACPMLTAPESEKAAVEAERHSPRQPNPTTPEEAVKQLTEEKQLERLLEHLRTAPYDRVCYLTSKEAHLLANGFAQLQQEAAAAPDRRAAERALVYMLERTLKDGDLELRYLGEPAYFARTGEFKPAGEANTLEAYELNLKVRVADTPDSFQRALFDIMRRGQSPKVYMRAAIPHGER